MDVADLRVKFSADTSDAERGIASIGKSIQGLGGGITQAGRMLSLGLTAPLVAVGAAAIATGTKLNAAMANIGSMGVATARVNELKKAIQDTSIQMGKTTDDLAKGTYQIISAFGDNASTIQSLQVNSKIAAAGMAELRDVVNMTSIVTKNWGDTSIEAQKHVGDLALKTVALGQTTLPELASSLGAVAPAAHAAGVSQQELFAIMATASGVTGATSAVVTQLNGVMSAFAKPSTDMKDLLKQQGYASGEAAIKALGFAGAIQMVYDAHVKTGTALASYTKRIEGARLIQALATTSADSYTKNLHEMANALGMTDEAYKAQTEGVNKAGFAMEQAKAKMVVFLQNINDGMGPALLALTDLVSPLIDKLMEMSKTFAGMDPDTQKWIVGIAAAAAAVGPLLIVVGMFTTALGTLWPVLGVLGSSLFALAIPLGLLYVAYQHNLGGLQTLVNSGLKHVQAAAPLAGKAIGELIDRLKYAGTNTFYANDAIYKFTEALTGSKDIAKNVSETIVGLIGQIDSVKRAFNNAGGGVSGFAAAIGTLTGGTVTVDVKTKVTSIDWGNVLDFTLDLTNKFVKLTWKDVFDFTLDWKAGFTKFTWNDVFDFTLDWTAGFTKLTWGDVFGFTLNWTGSFVKFNWGDVFAFSLDWKASIAKLTWTDVFDFTLTNWTATFAKLTWSDVFSFSEMIDLKAKQLAFSEVFAFTLEWAPKVVKLTWSDVFDFSLTSLGFKPMKLTWDDVFDFTLSNVTIKATKLTWEDVFAFSKTITLINGKLFPWADVFGFSQALDLTLLKKFTWSDVFDFTTNLALALSPPTVAGQTIGEYIGSQFKDIKLNLSVGRLIMWAEVFTFPQLMPLGVAELISWEKVFSFALAWTPSIAKILAWAEVFGFSLVFPASIASIINWSDVFSFTLSWTPTITWPDVPAWITWLMGGGAKTAGPPAPARGDPEVIFNPPTKIYIPGQAAGTADFAGGWTWVGEKGPELLNLPSGSKILSNADSAKMIGHLADGNFTATPVPWAQGAGQAITATPTAWKNSEDYLKKIADATTDNTREAKRAADVLVLTKKFTATPMPDIHQAFDKLSAAQIASATAIGKSLSTAGIKNEQSAREIAGSFKGTMADFKSFLQGVPGLFKTSSVTQKQLDLAKLGVPQNFADDWIRHLTDEVVNGVQWKDADIKDAALRAGLDPGLPAKAILEMVTEKWNDQSLFADKKNLDLINMDAVKQAMAQQAASKAGAANIMALFGIEPAAAQTQAKEAGQNARTALQQGFTAPSTAGVAGAAGQKDIMSTLLGGATITPESVAPLAQSFIAAFSSALAPQKDSTGKAAGVDFGAQIAASITASVTDSKAFETVGPAILKKITDSWKTITNVDFVGGIVTAFTVQLGADSSIEALKTVGGKIAKLLKLGIDEYFKDASIVDSVKNSLPSKPPVVPVKIPGNALGTAYWRGGLSWVGERGAELVNLPRGSQVFSNSQSMAMAGVGGGDINVYINATVDNRLDLESLAYTVAQKIQRRGR
jgi:TP901 family phage tail tape measure protein